MNKLIALVFGMAIVALCSCATQQRTKVERTKPHKTDCLFFNKTNEDEFLACSVRVNKNKTSTSSGTIIKILPICESGKKDRTQIWVLSTGHMRDRVEPEIEIFYLDNKRLDTPLIVKGEILLLVENGIGKGVDFSVIKTEIEGTGVAYKPLAPEGYTIKDCTELYSVGCDLGIEPKFFNVTAHKHNKFDLEIKEPAGVGRSGGGLFTVDGKYVVGVCWGGSNKNTFFTMHKTIHKIVQASGLEENLK